MHLTSFRNYPVYRLLLQLKVQVKALEDSGASSVETFLLKSLLMACVTIQTSISMKHFVQQSSQFPLPVPPTMRKPLFMTLQLPCCNSACPSPTATLRPTSCPSRRKGVCLGFGIDIQSEQVPFPWRQRSAQTKIQSICKAFSCSSFAFRCSLLLLWNSGPPHGTMLQKITRLRLRKVLCTIRVEVFP